ncbi:NAD-dependent epimerase/dehydratase family protein [Nocardia sp. NPDC056100]|uniref:NAD-dependent epimerase/dehydratase family protein n=1 Tax=Nocardia sp. NPDC056100 TaxID=3345712 RepID=UPI0035DCF801
MPLHIVIGAGPVGTATALQLATGGARVRLLTRHGSGPEHPGIERIAADATDPAALAAHCAGAIAVYQCAQPPYHRWPQEFPALHRAVLTAVERSGAVLVTVGNLYGYGEFDGPVTEVQALRPNSVKGRVRADMWTEQLAAHQAGRIRTAEVRGSDYLGPQAVSAATTLLLPALLSGRRALVPADLDAPHTWTATDDVAALLIAVAADDTAWGRAWHVPSAPPVSVRALADLLAAVAGVAPARVMRMPAALLWSAGLFVPAAREMRELRYQFDRPFIMDSASATKHFDLDATPLEETLRRTVDAFRGDTAQRGMEPRR